MFRRHFSPAPRTASVLYNGCDVRDSGYFARLGLPVGCRDGDQTVLPAVLQISVPSSHCGRRGGWFGSARRRGPFVMLCLASCVPGGAFCAMPTCWAPRAGSHHRIGCLHLHSIRSPRGQTRHVRNGSSTQMSAISCSANFFEYF